MPKSIIVAFRENEPDRHCVLDRSSSMCVVGRTPESDLSLPDPTVSRRHAVIRLEDGAIRIEDCGSTNGIFINGEKVERSVLREGDFLTLGAYTLVMRTLGECEGEPAPAGSTVFLDQAAVKRIRHELLGEYGSKHSAALYQAILLLGEIHDYDELLRRVLALVVDSLGAGRGAIVVRENSLTPPHVAAKLSLAGDTDESFLSRTLVEYALNTRSAFLTEDAQTDARFSGSRAVKQKGIRAVMCAPLIGSRDMTGVFYVDTSGNAAGFSGKELEFLTAAANLVGMAIENRIQDQRMIRQQRLAAMGQAIAGICHDVKNVLTGVTVGIESVEAACQEAGAEKITKACRIASKSASHLESYLTNLLAFAKEGDIARAPSDIVSVIQDVMEMERPYAAEYGVELSYRGGDLGPANLDATQLERVFINLIRNAVDACRAGGGTVSISASQKNDALQVKIGDTGAGISPEDVPHLAEPFFSTKGRKGTGLGLAVSFRIVEQHGGNIAIASEMGKGTIFRITIPGCFTSAMYEGTPTPPDAADSTHESESGVFSTPYPIVS